MFLFFDISSWNFHGMRQGFLCTQKRDFSWIWPKKNLNPYCKNRSLWQRHVYRHDVAKVVDFYNGVYGEILELLLDAAEISYLST